MGMYDSFRGECPSCGGEFEVQTKLFECRLKDLKIGDTLSAAPDTPAERAEQDPWHLLLKNPCHHCDNPIVVTMFEGRISSFKKLDDRLEQVCYREGAWGAVEGPC